MATRKGLRSVFGKQMEWPGKLSRHRTQCQGQEPGGHSGHSVSDCSSWTPSQTGQPSGSVSMPASRKAVVSSPCCLGDLWPLHCQLGKVESEKVPGGCLRVPTTSYG